MEQNSLNLNELNELKVKYLGKNGEVTELLKELKKCLPSEKPILGKSINDLRQTIEKTINTYSRKIEEEAKSKRILAHI